MNIIGRPAVVVHFILIRGYNGVEITKEHGIMKTIVQLLLSYLAFRPIALKSGYYNNY